jgi:predicted nucleic acid-binding protein
LKLIVDTNIILKSLIKDSKVRAILLNPNHQFYLPEYAIEEIEEHMPLLIGKTGLLEEEIKLALNILLTKIQVLPFEEVWKNGAKPKRSWNISMKATLPF